MTRTAYLLSAATLACLAASGCHIDTHKDGNKDNVSISTPFGGMHVDTHDDTDTTSLGLTAYPGATPLQENDRHDKNSANIDMSFGEFHLGVKATSFRTTDAPDKVLAFYRKDLGKYGDVVECKNNKAVGQPDHTTQGLTCESTGKSASVSATKDHFNIDSDTGAKIELRAGSQQHEHIVGVDKKDGYTKIGLVLLDLPGHIDSHNGKEVE